METHIFDNTKQISNFIQQGYYHYLYLSDSFINSLQFLIQYQGWFSSNDFEAWYPRKLQQESRKGQVPMKK
jgi:hypothetical protein